MEANLPQVVVITEDLRQPLSPLEVAGFSVKVCQPDMRSLRSMVRTTRPTWLLIKDAADEATAMVLISEALRASPNLLVAMLGASDDFAQCERAVRQGVVCYLASTTSPDRLSMAMGLASKQGVVVIDGCFHKAMLALVARLRPGSRLSSRELGVLRLVCQGLKNAEIAQQLNLSEHTVEFHVENIASKLGARNRAHAVGRAILLGLLASAEIQEQAAERANV